MNGRAYYNENDPFAAQWLRNLIAAGHIAPGDVDERSIVDVRPGDVRDYTQCHFFAGIGIWSSSLRDAGVRDTDHVWTGSCPCQPFSAAGQRGGFADERHLWPAFFHLIKECRPAIVLGEQVASPDGLQWLDLVSSDLEGTGYAVGAADLCAAGIAVAAGETEVGQPTLEWIRGAVQSCPDPFLAAELRDYAEWFDREAGIGPAHIRQRLCWMAYASGQRRQQIGSRASGDEATHGWQSNGDHVIAGDGATRSMADADEGQCGRIADREGRQSNRAPAGWQQGYGEFESGRATGWLADSTSDGRREERAVAGRFAAGDRTQGLTTGLVPSGAAFGLADSDGRNAGAEWQQSSGQHGQQPQDCTVGAWCGSARVMGDANDTRSQGRSEHRDGADQWLARPTSLAGWTRADWIICADGKARPIEPGTQPLAHGQSNRVGRLRAYGNAMHRAKITQFILAADEAIGALP